MNENCDTCKVLVKPKHPIIETDNWRVGLGNDQAYLGRAFVTLRTHKGSLSELSDAGWEDFRVLVRKLEKAYNKAFSAEPLNWTCLMNNAYRKLPAHPHVHWHIFPRYNQEVALAGITFDDPAYGEHYEVKAMRKVDDKVLDKIAEKLKAYL